MQTYISQQSEKESKSNSVHSVKKQNVELLYQKLYQLDQGMNFRYFFPDNEYRKIETGIKNAYWEISKEDFISKGHRRRTYIILYITGPSSD